MKNRFVMELKPGMKVEDFFMVKNSDTKTDKNGNYYLDMTVSDNSGDIVCRKFRATNEEIEFAKIGQILKISGVVKEYNGNINFNANTMEGVEESEYSILDYIAAAPIKPEEMLSEIKVYINKIKNKDIRKVVIEILSIYKDKLMYYPAAKSNHHSIKSGLLYHMLRMLKTGESIGSVYENINMDLVYAGVLLHDICKIEEMDSNSFGVVKDYTMEGKLLGHIVMGIKIIEKVADKFEVDKEIRIILEHLLLTHHYEPEYGSPKKPMFLEAEILHYLDIIDARVFDFEKALKGVEPGKFSDRVWVLDNRTIYNPEYDKDQEQPEMLDGDQLRIDQE